MEKLYLDVDIVMGESGELRANVDFSRYVGHVRAELSRQIVAAILDSVEPQLNALGWFKERTCRIVKTWSDSDYVDGWRYRCSECSCFIPVNERDEETGDVISAANYCPNCGAKVLGDER